MKPPVSRDRIITRIPKWYTPEACLEFEERFDERVANFCRRNNASAGAGLKISKAVVVGDLCVGKTSLINRFCKNVFDRDYKATIGVDFEIERFEIAGIPYNLQIWDTAGQEKFKCIASAYYRGAQVIITVFDLADIQTLGHTKQWLQDAANENGADAASVCVFLVGTKTDLLSDAERRRTESDAVRVANEMGAEYWSVSAKTGENVAAFFSRVAALAFEKGVLAEMEKNGGGGRECEIGDLVRTSKNQIRCFYSQKSKETRRRLRTAAALAAAVKPRPIAASGQRSAVSCPLPSPKNHEVTAAQNGEASDREGNGDCAIGLTYLIFVAVSA